MVIGIDVDGVLANFVSAYSALLSEVSGRVLPSKEVDEWNYEHGLGLSSGEVNEAWRRIKRSKSFWADLDHMPGVDKALFERLNEIGKIHEVYYITSRPGTRSQEQTQVWLEFGGIDFPTVMISSEKALAVMAVAADVYIDDRLANANSVMAAVRAAGTLQRVYLQDATYNRKPPLSDDADPKVDTHADQALIRVTSVAAMLDAEGL